MEITRRTFTGFCAALPMLAGGPIERLSLNTQRTYDIFGVPLRTVSLHPGCEDDAGAYRQAGLLEKFDKAGINCNVDGGIGDSGMFGKGSALIFRPSLQASWRTGRFTVYPTNVYFSGPMIHASDRSSQIVPGSTVALNWRIGKFLQKGLHR